MSPRPALLFVCLAATAACSDDERADPAPSWRCPAGWAPYAGGGCAPAATLCAQDGGPCGDAAVTLLVPANGPPQGPWPQPGEPGGPPARDWRPAAGISTCPAGWVRGAGGWCDPSLPAACGEGSAAIPGGRCTPTAESDCAPSVEGYPPIPEGATEGAVFRVRAGAASEGADGSIGRPFATVAAAVASIDARYLRRAWVLLADGAHPGTTRVPSAATAPRSLDLVLVGSCAARVSLDAPRDDRALAAYGAGTVVTLRQVTVRGGRYSLQARDGATLRVERSVLRDASGAAVVAYRGSLRVEDSAVFTPRRLNGAGGIGIYGERGGTITLARAAVAGAPEAAVLVQEGSSLRADDLAVQGPGNVAVVAQTGGTLAVNRLVVTGTDGVHALGDGSAGSVSDVFIRRAGETLGRGLAAQDGASIEATRVAVLDAAGPAVTVQQGARVTLVEAVVRGAEGGEATAYGLVVDARGELTARRVLVASRVGAGALAQDATLALEDVAIEGIRAGTDRGSGPGVSIEGGARATLRRVRVEGAAGVGVNAADPSTELEVEDSLVTAIRHGTGRTSMGAEIRVASGLLASRQASLRASRVLVFETDERAVTASSGATLSLDRSVVERSRLLAGAAVDASYGLGVVAAGAAVTVRGSVLRGHPGVAAVSAEGGRLAMDDCLVADAPGDPGGFGTGLQVLWGSALAATRVVVADVRHAGVLAYAGPGEGAGAVARVDLREVIVRGVRPSPTGQGVGVAAIGAVTLGVDRLAVMGAHGMGVAVVGALGTAALRDVFVLGVARASFGQELGTPGVEVSNAFEVRGGARATVAHAVLDGAGGDWGILHRDADLTLADAVITRMRLGPGRVDRARPSTLRARGVRVTDSARGDFLDSAAAELAPLPVPSSVCPEPPCP